MLVNCVAYQDGRKLADIAPRRRSGEHVSRPECFVWVALKDPEPAEWTAMRQEFGLHELAVEDARHGHQRPKIEEYGNSLFVVLHTARGRARARVELGEVDVFVGHNYILSVRNGPSRASPASARAPSASPSCCGRARGSSSYALMDAVVDRYFPVIDALEIELEAIRGAHLHRARRRGPSIEALYDLKRQPDHAAARRASRSSTPSGSSTAGRVPRSAPERRSTSATSTTTCCA